MQNSVVERAKFILSHLDLHSVKPEQKKQGPKAKHMVQDQDILPKPSPPQMDLFADF
jgi:DNA mismatch repair protein MutS